LQPYCPDPLLTADGGGFSGRGQVGCPRAPSIIQLRGALAGAMQPTSRQHRFGNSRPSGTQGEFCTNLRDPPHSGEGRQSIALSALQSTCTAPEECPGLAFSSEVCSSWLCTQECSGEHSSGSPRSTTKCLHEHERPQSCSVVVLGLPKWQRVAFLRRDSQAGKLRVAS